MVLRSAMQVGWRAKILLFCALFAAYAAVCLGRYLREESVDLPSFYWGSVITFSDHRSPYIVPAFEEVSAAIGRKVHPFLYHPASLLLFYPLSLMEYETAKLSLFVLNLGAFAAFAYLMVFRLVRFSDRAALLGGAALCFYVIAFPPALRTIRYGQINIIVVLLIALSWYAFRERLPASLCAAPLAVAIILKTYPCLMLGVLVLRRRLREICWVLVFLLGAALLSHLLLPDGVWLDWWTRIVPSGGYASQPPGLFSPAHPSNQAFNGFAARLFLQNPFISPLWASEPLARAVPYVLSALVLLVTAGICAGGAAWNSRDEINLEMSMFLLAMYMVAPFSWVHHLVLVLPAVGIAIARLLLEPEPWRLRVATGMSIVLVAAPIPIRAGALSAGLPSLLISVKLYAVLALWVCLVILRYRGPIRLTGRNPIT